MAFTYGGDPENSDRDRVRFEIGDTDSNEQLLTDQEISFCINNNDTIWGACAQACEAIAAQLSKRTDVRAGPGGHLNVKLSQKVEQYTSKAAEFRRKAAMLRKPSVGGISISDKDSVEEDSDRVAPKFKKGLHDN